MEALIKTFERKGDLTICTVKKRVTTYFPNMRLSIKDEDRLFKEHGVYDWYITARGYSRKHKQDKDNYAIGRDNAELKAMVKIQKKAANFYYDLSIIFSKNIYKNVCKREYSEVKKYVNYYKKYKRTFLNKENNGN